MKKQIIFSHGGKGGVGKSWTAMVLTEGLLAAGERVSVVEADPTQPDIAKRYVGDHDVSVGVLTLNRAGDAENAVAQFGEWLEQSGAAQVVINLPAGAGETLDAHGDLLADLATALDYRLVCTYALEKNRVAADELVSSLREGLMAHVADENRFIVIPAYKGDPSTFEWMTHPERERFGIQEIVMPALGNRGALRRLEATPGRAAAIADKATRPEGWMIVDQSSVHRWYHAALKAIKPILAGAV